MDRLACVSLPWFPLQILLQRQPEWRSFPVAVISRDEPSGELLWVNDAAWKSRVRPGLSYSAALSICRELRAAEVGAELIEQQIVALAKQLKKFSPAVEASREQPGIFWIDASGLQHLYPDLETWGAALQKELHLHQFLCNVVIGFGRFSSYALACSNHRAEVTVLPDRAQEQSSAAEVPLERLGISSSVRRSMNDLAIVTVGQFLALPLASVRRRFGIDAARLRDVAEERGWTPFSCEPDREPASRSIVLEDAISHTEPVLFLARGLLDSLLEELASRSQALATLIVDFDLDHAPLSPSLSRQEQLSPAQPTLDASLILELLRLRLEGSPNPSAITGLRLQALALPADTEQLRLLAEKPKRDLVAANRALARLRAELGDQAVVVAELCSRHLPEAGFRWVPLESLTKASPRFVQKPPLVRRIREQSQPLDTLGRVKDLTGPYRVCGGWWQGEVERDYYFAVTDHREMLWVYYDQRRQRWFLQGQIE